VGLYVRVLTTECRIKITSRQVIYPLKRGSVEILGNESKEAKSIHKEINLILNSLNDFFLGFSSFQHI
jgi:predicted translin family RNA/ssDNA-binding protein